MLRFRLSLLASLTLFSACTEDTADSDTGQPVEVVDTGSDATGSGDTETAEDGSGADTGANTDETDNGSSDTGSDDTTDSDTTDDTSDASDTVEDTTVEPDTTPPPPRSCDSWLECGAGEGCTGGTCGGDRKSVV